jgi:hypothetical protein
MKGKLLCLNRKKDKYSTIVFPKLIEVPNDFSNHPKFRDVSFRRGYRDFTAVLTLQEAEQLLLAPQQFWAGEPLTEIDTTGRPLIRIQRNDLRGYDLFVAHLFDEEIRHDGTV